MRIISKEKDYYDSAMSHGQDLTVVFNRAPVELKAKELPTNIYDVIGVSGHLASCKNKDVEVTMDRVCILFCGKLYRGVHCTIATWPKGAIVAHNEYKTFYKLDELVAFLATYDLDLADKKYSKWSNTKQTSDRVEKFLKLQGTEELLEEAIKNRWVIMTSSLGKNDASANYWQGWYNRIILNGSNLKTFQFFKVFDSATTYQELDMFISGTLPQSTQMPMEIEDKYRVAQHGFDKFSFRKPKSKKK